MSLDPSLQHAMDSIAVPGLQLGHRLIAPGDETVLLLEEATAIASALPEIRRASGAARIVARELMARLGCPPAAIRKDASGMPIWPEGLVGSLAHDDRVAVAAVGRSRDFATLGVDVEPACPLPADMLDLVVSERERVQLAADPLRGRLLFVAKEAVYKAVYPLDRVFLEFGDIEVDLAAGKAVTRTGRVIALRSCVASHIVAVAFA
jgi:4'-phosphopantetheinyl transferase EntD